MKKTPSLLSLKAADVELVKNRPAISVFRDNLSLGAVLEKAYITPKYKLCKHGQEYEGIAKIYEEYGNKNVIFVGEGGAGKTSAFLRLYTDTEEDMKEIGHKQFFYFFAPDLKCDEQDGGQKPVSYKKMLREIISSGSGLNGILLLDGLEEAYLNNGKKAGELLRELADSKIVFWVSCRTSFYERLDDDIIPLFAEKVHVKDWDSDDFEKFISNCLKGRRDGNEIKTRINRLKKHAASLTERPLFATMILFAAEDSKINDVYNEYELIGLFLNKWMERERREKRIVFDREAVYKALRDIALSVYLRTNKRPKYHMQIRVFRDLLVMSDSNDGADILSFYHREFLVYFIVNALIDAALDHPDKILWWFSQTFYDDITNLIKPVLARMDRDDIERIYNNLFSVYRQTYEKTNDVSETFKALGLPPEESFLKLRDEVLYFILRLKLPDIDYNTFVRYAYENSSDTMLFLGIAYGMAAIDPNNRYTLEFAKKLEPGKKNKEEIRNRGWGICFFGDVDGNGYTYDDSEGKPWNKLRENRLKRLSDNEKKYVTRVLDIPLLHCFYASRGFRDCTSFRDYAIIKNTDISRPCFDKEQQAFMQERRSQLVYEYRRKLLLDEIKINPRITNKIQKERIVKMADDRKKTVLEIDEELAERILKQIEHKEIVCKNIKSFWEQNGTSITEKYKNLLTVPEHHNILRNEFDKKIKRCKVLIISANYVEGVIVTRRLMQSAGKEKLDAYPIDGHLYQFASIDSIPVLHIWPTDKSSYTLYGSFSAVDGALDRFSPKYVLAVGVAFGIDPNKQSLGDVLVAKDLVFYDNFNKVTDGKMKLRPQDTYQIDAGLNAQVHQLDIVTPPESVGKFKWFFNAMLTGGTVLSDADEKEKLLHAATDIGYEIVGGEMEASGIYYACQRIKNRKTPFFIIKGICDWGAEKNGWKDVSNRGRDSNDGQDSKDKIKDYVQAFACDHAYNAMCYIISQLNMDNSSA